MLVEEVIIDHEVKEIMYLVVPVCLSVCLPSVDIRGSALPIAVKSNENQRQSKVLICVSIISWRMRI